MPPTPPPVQTPQAPTVELEWLNPARSVRFDYATLAAIEEAFGKSVNELGADLQKGFPAERPEGGVLTPEQTAQVIRCTRWSVASRFVAACLGVPLGELGAAVPLKDGWATYFALLSGFGAAMNQMNGGDTSVPPAGQDQPAQVQSAG